MKHTTFLMAAAMGAAYLAAPATAHGAVCSPSDLRGMDSDRFDFKYEMDALPTQVDADADGHKDFTAAGNVSGPASGGIVTCSFQANSYYKSDSGEGQAGDTWRKISSYAGDTGYTIELKMKLRSQSNGTAMSLTASDGSGDDMLLSFHTNRISWAGTTLAEMSTTDDFHTYRVARFPGIHARFAVWRDGRLVAWGLNDALPSNNGLNRLLFGAIGTAFGGSAQVDYLRFSLGAYAPAPEKKGSAEFQFKYEMEKAPNQENIDGEAGMDFGLSSGATAVPSDGIVTCGFGGNKYFYSNGGASGSGVWKKLAPKAWEGYTIELRMKLLAQTSETAMSLTASDGSDSDMLLHFHTNRIVWSDTTLAEMSTTDGFHTYRVAKFPDEDRFAVWIDGALVAGGLCDALPNNDGLNRLLFGAIGTAFGGSAEVGYLRIAKGAYAPGDATKDSSDFEHKCEMTSSDFSPNASTSQWSLTSDGGTASLSGGVLVASQPKGKCRHYKTTGAMDANIQPYSPFTVEVKLRVSNAWAGTSGRVVNLLCGSPRAAGCLFIGTDKVQDKSYSTLRAGDNSDKMHVFRIAYGGDEADGFTVWRDGVKIAEHLPRFTSGGNSVYNFVRFGVASASSHGGDFEVDYVRWTTGGAYAPPVPQKGMCLWFE